MVGKGIHSRKEFGTVFSGALLRTGKTKVENPTKVGIAHPDI